MSKNVNGEEINEELFLKKINRKLSKISELIDEEMIGEEETSRLQKHIHEYSMIFYHYGAFMEHEKSSKMIREMRSAMIESMHFGVDSACHCDRCVAYRNAIEKSKVYAE